GVLRVDGGQAPVGLEFIVDPAIGVGRVGGRNRGPAAAEGDARQRGLGGRHGHGRDRGTESAGDRGLGGLLLQRIRSGSSGGNRGKGGEASGDGKGQRRVSTGPAPAGGERRVH